MSVDEKRLLSTPAYGHRHRRSQAVSLDLKRDICIATPQPTPTAKTSDDHKKQPQQGKVKFSPVVETIPRFQKEEMDSKSRHRRRRSLSSFFPSIQFRKAPIRSATPPLRRAPEAMFDLDVVANEHIGHKRAGSCPEFVAGSQNYGYFSKKRKMESVREESRVASSIAARSSTSTLCTFAEREPLPSPFSDCSEDWHDRATIFGDMDLVQRDYDHTKIIPMIDIGEPGPECPSSPSPIRIVGHERKSSRWNKYRFWKTK